MFCDLKEERYIVCASQFSAAIAYNSKFPKNLFYHLLWFRKSAIIIKGKNTDLGYIKSVGAHL